jgi:hypothetical protein
MIRHWGAARPIEKGGSRNRLSFAPFYAETKEMRMPVSNLMLLERIARVLAGRDLSINAEGDDPSAGPNVDESWRDYTDDALSILRTMREPDAIMAAAGDPAIWEAMVEAELSAEHSIA